MSEPFTVEDGGNVANILQHHLGHPWDDGAKLTQDQYEALERDLLRYCTRLRCQPNTQAHSYTSGGDTYRVPAYVPVLGAVEQ